MRLVSAVIRQERLDAVLASLESQGVRQMTITPVTGCGHEVRSVITFRGVRRHERRIPRIKLEVAVDEKLVHEVIDAIGNNANTSKVGDGVIWVSKLDQFVRVRTGEGVERPPFHWPRPAACAG